MKNEIKLELKCMIPNPEHPFYHVVANFNFNNPSDYQINKVKVNEREIRDLYVYHNDLFQKDQKVRSGGYNDVVVRWDWNSGDDISVDIYGKSKEEKDSLSLSGRVTAPSNGGYWNPSWKHYAGIVLRETAGVSRINEPVHVTLAVYSDRIKYPEKETRIIAIDPETGKPFEVPSQVYAVSCYLCDKPDERYQATTIFEVAFLADVPANSSRVYLAFYGNQDVSRPVYDSGLVIHGEGLGLTVENHFFKIRLSEKSGAVDEITMKMGKGYTFEHHLETNGALHWNPDVYAPPRPWLHASDWDPPAKYEIIKGNIFAMTKRSDSLNHYPETDVSINYTFYDRVPWIIISSSIEIKKDVDVKALRNGEIVLDRKLVDEFAWREPDGGTGSMMITDGPRHPKHAKVLPYDNPWVCFISSDHHCGLGVITIRLANFSKYGSFSRIFQPYSYLQWGPWVYYARPLVYTFASNNPGRSVTVPAGNMYYEKIALIPLLFEENKKALNYLEQLYIQLANPLYINIVEDTDERVSEEWIPPILVEDFEEMEAD